MAKFTSSDLIRIIQIDGSEIFYYVKTNQGLVIQNKKDDFGRHFSELLSPNLDVEYLKSVNKFKIKELLGEKYSYDFINVAFDYETRINNKGERIYKKEKNCKCFDQSMIREYLYLNGFDLNDVHYVRYKRSSGAARSGHCLFVKESLLKTLEKWSNTKLNPKDFVNNLVSFEAYKALSLSSLEDTVVLNPYNILFVKDYESTLPDENVAHIYVDENSRLQVEEKKCDITNNIWDGEGLLDISIFREKGLSKKGMVLLRNRFFKCCAFNTNLQKWFKENGITSVEQLNGYTLAKNIKDIRLVVTESSLKYFKMVSTGFSLETINQWCDAVSDENHKSIFGIVKTDKPTRFFNGEMVETTYQLLNTLPLNQQSKINSLVALNLDYINKIREIKDTPEYARYYFKGETDPYDDFLDEYQTNIDDSEDISDSVLEETNYTYKKIVCNMLLDINRDIIKTSMFRYLIYDETISSLAMKLYNGRVLIHGTTATLFGNPYELLLNIVNKFDGKSHYLNKDEICCSFFNDGDMVVGSRSPHVTMGNVLYAKNRRNPDIEKWFNLSKEIVIVDAINNNVQHRLNGADYDSDTMILTDDKFIVEAGKKVFKNFLVPYADLRHVDNKLMDLDKDQNINVVKNLSKIDDKIANNKVGTIINYSQLLNSYYWNLDKKDCKKPEIYLNIAKLAILAGAEIDSAKRSFDFTTEDELNEMKEYLISLDLVSKDKKSPAKQPLFFYKVGGDDNVKSGEIDTFMKKNNDKYFKTTMDMLWKKTYESKLTGSKITDPITFSELTEGEIDKSKRDGRHYDIADNIIKCLDEIYVTVGASYKKKSDNDSYEIDKRNFKRQIDNAVHKFRNYLDDLEMMRLVIIRLDKKRMKDDKEKERGRFSNLFLLLFYILLKYHGKKARDFFLQLFNSNDPVYTLKSIAYSKELKYSLFDRFGYKIDKSVYDDFIDAIFA